MTGKKISVKLKEDLPDEKNCQAMEWAAIESVVLFVTGLDLWPRSQRWGVQFPHCASLTGAGLRDPLDSFQVCISKIIII